MRKFTLNPGCRIDFKVPLEMRQSSSSRLDRSNALYSEEHFLNFT